MSEIFNGTSPVYEYCDVVGKDLRDAMDTHMSSIEAEIATGGIGYGDVVDLVENAAFESCTGCGQESYTCSAHDAREHLLSEGRGGQPNMDLYFEAVANKELTRHWREFDARRFASSWEWMDVLVRMHVLHILALEEAMRICEVHDIPHGDDPVGIYLSAYEVL